MRDEALDFRARGEIDQRDAVGNAVGDVKGFARRSVTRPTGPQPVLSVRLTANVAASTSLTVSLHSLET